MKNDETRARPGAIIPVFLMLAVVFSLSAVGMFWMQRILQHAERDVVHQHLVIDDVRQALSTVKDAETGQRGFLLTGDEAYLTPYLNAQQEIEANLRDLDYYAAAGFLPADAVAKYRGLIDSKFRELEKTIKLRRSQGADAAIAVLRTNRGKQIMDQLRSLTDELVSSAGKLMAEKRATVEKLSQDVGLLLWAVVLLNFVLLGWAYLKIRGEIILREAARLEVLRRQELLRVTLASIGDGVIVTDESGRLTFINPVAVTLCGWNPQEAIGRRCEEVFRIIHESTRKTVESPVDRVLRDGVIVGLANHTLLIRKDGMEIPIDDSGAPIKDADGSLRGVVLVFRDFTEHKHAEEALRLAMEDAQAANIAKDNFLATLSHELRTPITPVLMTLTNWIETGEPPKTWREDVEMMERNMELEARLIDDLLDLTRIVRGKLSLNVTLADVNELIEAVARMYQSEISAKGLRLSIDLKALKHHAYVDPARLQQVFLNVLKNATKFTAAGGQIEVWTENAENQVNVSVRDTGVGMTEDIKARLFRPFEQGTDEVVRRYGGLGLGMAISKALMEVHGGTISAQSDGPGTGSTFQMAIPVAEAGQPELNHNQPDESAFAQRSYKILLVEDHVDTAHALCRLLERQGHEITTAHTMAEAVTRLEANGFDLMLSDIGLPDGTGIDLMRKVRAISSLPAIAITGFGMEQDVVSCREAGFDEHLTKPMNFQKLQIIIEQLMQSGERVG